MDILALYESDVRRIRNKRRRQRQVQKNIALLTVTLLLVITFSIIFGSIFASAESQETERKFKYYASIEVKYGESLWSIAEQHIDRDYYKTIKDYIDEVKQINHLTDEHIRAGQYIIIPYFTDEFVGG